MRSVNPSLEKAEMEDEQRKRENKTLKLDIFFLFNVLSFAEFNRISVEVLSVVAVQVKSVQDAIRDKKDIFNFMGEMIKCVPTVGIFITMNPGELHCTQHSNHN